MEGSEMEGRREKGWKGQREGTMDGWEHCDGREEGVVRSGFEAKTFRICVTVCEVNVCIC